MTVNQQQSAAWNGGESVHYVDHADRYDAQLAAFADVLSERAAIRSVDSVLDIGCGSGTTTLRAAAAARRAVGLDISVPLLAVAAARAARSGSSAEFVTADAQTHDFAADRFDVVISLFGTMFFDDPVRALGNIHGAMTPGGRAVFVAWQSLSDNEWLAPVIAAVSRYAEVPNLGGLSGGPGMFAWKNADEVVALLTDAGFAAAAAEPISTSIVLAGGASLEESTAFFLGMGIVKGILGRIAGGADRAAATAAMRSTIAERYVDGIGVRLGAAGLLVTATA